MTFLRFESLADSVARPALLGVLTVDDARRASFTMFVLDPMLSPAVGTSGVCRVTSLATAVAEVLTLPGPVVSWSERELQTVRAAGLPPRLVRRCEARWVTALPGVRRWRSRLYPGWTPPALARMDRQTLEVYMKAVGCGSLRLPAPGRWASWLREVRPRVRAAGRQRRVLSASARRDWHALLESQRHHCEGLRAVFERATRELMLEGAYRQTTYRVALAGASHQIRIGRPHRTLDRALGVAGVTRWACITACNPQSVLLTARENERRTASLKRRLREGGIRWQASAAVGDDGAWPPELGVLALGVSRRWAKQTGRDFEQAAVVWGRVGGKAELVWCNSLQKPPRAFQ